MSFHDNFGRRDQPGLVSSVDPQSAVHQFRISLAVALALTVAIGASAFALSPVSGFDPQSRSVRISDAVAVNHHNLDASLRTLSATGG